MAIPKVGKRNVPIIASVRLYPDYLVHNLILF